MKTDKHILIVEDDASMREMYADILSLKFETTFTTNIKDTQDALNQCRESDSLPDLIIADLKLPDGNFLNVLSSSEENTLLSVPFMIVSYIDDIDALRFCLEEGALDYLTKPFKATEFLVKIERLFDSGLENYAQKQPVSTVKELNNELTQKIRDNLTSKELKLFNLFIEADFKTLTRDQIFESIWRNTSVHPKTLDVHMYNLRRKLQTFGVSIVSKVRGKWTLIVD